MKHLVAFFFLIISLIVCGSQLKYHKFNAICNLGDSIADMSEGKEFLYYTTGHHGHIWALVFSQNGHYIVVSGNTRNNDCRIDTISINESRLKWGFDTMAFYCHKMKPVENSSYWPFHERLILFSSQNEIFFDSSDTNTYSGVDSVIFNKKLKELKYLMYWFASSIEIRKKLPTPL